jgi:crotonobetainyl-CoA:carnitine CoA-transferase CaiB-like acyl-CoA transferase
MLAMGPLDDVRVIEVDNWMAAPSAAAILADLGAEVIKVEPLGGDPMRDMDRPAKIDNGFREYDLQFDVDNRGKHSIAVALDTEAGADVVRKLCQGADVFMCNLLTRRQEKFGLDPERLMAENPRLVHATLTGYGTQGPEAWRPGYDVTAFFGRSGLYDSMREGDDGLVPMARPAQGDHTTGLALATAILAALRLAERSGEGQVVETSLYAAAVWSQATDFAVTAVDGAPVRRRSRNQQIVATANRFPCGDGKWVVFNMPKPADFAHVCQAIGLDHLIDEERFATPKSRYANMAELVANFDEALSVRSRDEWGKIFDEHSFIWGPVLGIHEVVSDPQAVEAGLFPTIEHPEYGPYRTVAIPMTFANTDVGPKGSAPTLGQHTKSVLLEAGFSEADVQALTDSGAVA